MRTIQTKVYQYEELSPQAQEKAREWYREGAFDYEWWDSIYDDANAIATLMGIDIRKLEKRGLCIYFSGFSSQGDGACFEGVWRAADVKPGRVKEWAGRDEELHRIAAEFEKVAKQFPHAYFAVTHSGRYSHENSCTFDFQIVTDVDGDNQDAPQDAIDQAEATLKDAAKDFMRWIYRTLEKEHDWMNEDAQLAEAIIANEYEFTEAGRRFP